MSSLFLISGEGERLPMNNRRNFVEGGASARGQEVIDVEQAVRPKKQQKRLINFPFFHRKLHNKSSIKFKNLVCPCASLLIPLQSFTASVINPTTR